MISILGATGFIGQNLVSSLPGSKAVSLRERDWFSVVSTSDVIINLVGKAHDHRGTASEQDFYYANFELTKQVYSAYISSSARLLIHISSLAAVEEMSSKGFLAEDSSCNPISWYGHSKRTAEKWLLEQHLPPGKKLVILRPPMVHGPGDKGNLGLLYKLISKGIPYPLASFDNRRSFISIDNFSFFIEQIITHHEKMDSGIYHIADDEPVSTKEIIELIKKVTAKNSPDIAFPKFIIKAIAKIGNVVPLPLNTTRLKKMTSDLLVSNDKIKAALGIEKLPFTAKEGLEKTIQSFKQPL